MSRLLGPVFIVSCALLGLTGCDTAEQCAEASAPCPSCVRVATEAGCPTWTCPGNCVPASPGGGSADTMDDLHTSDLGSTPSTGVPPTTSSPPTTGSGGQGVPYRYVRINDLSSDGDTLNGGADIDAVILDKPDGRQAFATTIEAYNHGGGFVEGPDLDPVEALGRPDAFFDYPNVAVCDLDSGYISLGGPGGYIIVGMGDAIEAGDGLTVLEVGGCFGNDGAEGIMEEIEVQVAVGFDIHEQWVTVGHGEGPMILLPVPTLPVIAP